MAFVLSLAYRHASATLNRKRRESDDDLPERHLQRLSQTAKRRGSQLVSAMREGGEGGREGANSTSGRAQGDDVKGEVVVEQPDGLNLSIGVEEQESQRRQRLRQNGYPPAVAASPSHSGASPGVANSWEGREHPVSPRPLEAERLAQRRKHRSLMVWLSLDSTYYLVLTAFAAAHLFRVGCCDREHEGVAGKNMPRVLGAVDAPIEVAICTLALHLLLNLLAVIGAYAKVPFLLLIFIFIKSALTAFEILYTFAALVVVRIFTLCTASQVRSGLLHERARTEPQIRYATVTPSPTSRQPESVNSSNQYASRDTSASSDTPYTANARDANV